jgi:PIN domain nuclease of toxin-antitoxin system
VILLDTHVLLWLSFDPNRLSALAHRAIADAQNKGEALAICDISLLELAILASKQRYQVVVDMESFLEEVQFRFTVLPITAKACARIATLPPNYPKDPADRAIATTALAEALPLVTADRAIRESRVVRTIW